MFKNYIKTAWRSLWKNKGYSFLNIGGLAIGIACAGLIFLWVEDELTWNHYFSDRENLYKVKDRQTYDGTTFVFDATPGVLAKGIKAEIPRIKKTARSTWVLNLYFPWEIRIFMSKGIMLIRIFLSMFQIKFIQGDAVNAFSDLYSIVISKKMAEKLTRLKV